MLIRNTVFFWVRLLIWYNLPISKLRNLRSFRKIALCYRKLYLQNPARLFIRRSRGITWKAWSDDLLVVLNKAHLNVLLGCLPFCIFLGFSLHNLHEDDFFSTAANFTSNLSGVISIRISLLLSFSILVAFSIFS